MRCSATTHMQRLPSSSRWSRLVVNTVHMFVNICRRAQFTNTFRNRARFQHANEHLLADPKSFNAPSAPPIVFAYEEMFARSVQTVFRSEHACRTSQHRTLFFLTPSCVQTQPWRAPTQQFTPLASDKNFSPTSLGLDAYS